MTIRGQKKHETSSNAEVIAGTLASKRVRLHGASLATWSTSVHWSEESDFEFLAIWERMSEWGIEIFIPCLIWFREVCNKFEDSNEFWRLCDQCPSQVIPSQHRRCSSSSDDPCLASSSRSPLLLLPHALTPWPAPFAGAASATSRAPNPKPWTPPCERECTVGIANVEEGCDNIEEERGCDIIEGESRV